MHSAAIVAVIAGKGKIRKAGSRFIGLLDQYPGAAVAFSFRKLSSSYLGPCIRVRNSSNVELDITFLSTPDANGNYWLDESALLAHCGSGNGFVTTWYDSSGNGRDAIQATAANQPRIVNAGVVDKFNGKPSIVFESARNTRLSFTGFPLVANLFIVFNASSANRRLTQGSNDNYNIEFNGSGFLLVFNSSAITTSTSQVGFNNQTSIGVQGAGSFIDIKGVTAVTGNVPANNPPPTYTIGGSGGTLFNGPLPELVVYPSIQSSKNAISGNQMTAFGVT